MSSIGPGRRSNVLLVVLDSVRAANCSLLGARRRTTPFLERLAGESTVYTQARAPSNWSLPSHASIFTGLETHAHGVTIDRRLDEGNTVFERLAESGYATALFTENGFLTSHDVGLKQAFETVEGVPDDYGAAYDTADRNPGPDGFYYAEQFLTWSEGRDDWAACLNLMDAHRPCEPREAYDQWADESARTLQRDLPDRWEWAFHGGDRSYWELRALESLYDGGIRQTDAILERVVERLRDREELDETLLVVCGDHGDGFGERGLLSNEPPAVSHIVPMQETLLHVPLLVRRPGQREAGTVHAPAALTGFHDAALAAGTGGTVTAGTFTGGPVVSTKQPVTGDLRERYERHCEDAERFTAASQAVYRRDPASETGVRKRYYWGENALEVAVAGPGLVHELGECSRSTVEAAVPAADESVAVDRPDSDELDPDKKAQLTALGYY